jgi:hypothetical protein
MTLKPAYAAYVVVAVVIVAAGLLAGRALKPDPTPGFAFDASSPAYDATTPSIGVTKGGFSGFGETSGLPGQTLLSGSVVSVSPTELVIQGTDGTKTSLRLGTPTNISRIQAANRDALRNGATVIVRQADGSDEVEAVLVLATP